jgi:integrase
VKLPKRVTEEAKPPSDEHFLAILDKLLALWRLFFTTIEQGGLRIGEAVALGWADVDVAGSRLRLPHSATKTDKARWVQLPKWLKGRSRRRARSRIAFRNDASSRGSTSLSRGRR